VRPGTTTLSSAGSRGATRHGSAPWLAVGAFVMVVVVVAAWTWHRLEVPGRPELPYYGMQDYRDAVYYPVRTLLAGDNPYSPSAIRRHFAPDALFPLYTPVHLALYLPYGLLPQRLAELLHFALSLALIVVLAYVAVRLCELPVTITLVFGLAAFLVASRAGYANLFYGQVAAFLVVATYGALHFARRTPWLAALCLAVACAKPSYGGPLALVLLAHGAFRAVVLGALFAGTATAIVGAFLLRAAGGIGPFVASLQENVAAWSRYPELSGAAGIHPVDVPAMLQRFVDIPPALQAALGIGLLALGAFAAARALPRSELLGECTAAVTVLACIHHQIYDLLLLAVPLTALASRRLAVGAGSEAARTALLALLGVALFNYAASYQVLDGFHVTGAARIAIVSTGGLAVTATFVALVWASLAAPPSTDPASR